MKIRKLIRSVSIAAKNPQPSLERAAQRQRRRRRQILQAAFEPLETRRMLTAFGYTGSIQTFTAPSTGSYQIIASGAEGGYQGGLGAVVAGEVTLTAGTTLTVVVGGQGGGINNAAGGGGGSFVYSPGASQPLVVAGGGGGYAFTASAAQLGVNGAAAGGSPVPNVGTGGYGGGLSAIPFESAGGGGGGWLGNGGAGPGSNSIPFNPGGLGGDGPPTFAGGVDDDGFGGYGGFGGGGSSGYEGGGGGGGYSGGDGGSNTDGTGAFVGGGGGGSYFGSSVIDTTGVVSQTGNGAVSITAITPLTFAVNYERSTTLLLTSNTGAATPTYSIVTAPSNGKLSNFNSATGTITYTPQTGFTGIDSFTFKASGSTIITDTVTLNVAASTSAPFMSLLSDNTPLSQISLPGTTQSESGPGTDQVPGIDSALFGEGYPNVVSTGPQAESDETLHITASLIAAAISALATQGVDNVLLDGAGKAANLAAAAADAGEGINGSSSGVGLGLSLTSDSLGEISDGLSVIQFLASKITAADDMATASQTATAEADASGGAANHTAAATDDAATATVDATAGTDNAVAATDDGAAGALDTTAGAEDTAAAVTDGTADGLDIAAEAQGGVDPVSDGVAAASDGVAAAEDTVATVGDGAADASDVVADTTDATAAAANGAATATETSAQAAGSNAGAEDSATASLASTLIAQLNKLATDHAKSAVNDGLSAVGLANSAAGDSYTASEFYQYFTGLGNPSTTGGNSFNNALQQTLYNDAVAEAATHTTSATLEAAAAATNAVATGLDSAASAADSAAASALQEEVAANLASVIANADAVTAVAAAEAANATATADEAAAAAENAAAIGGNTTAGSLDAAAGVADGVDAGANTAAAAADIAAIALDVTAAATVEIPFVDIGTAAAAAVGEAVAITLDAISDGADTAAEVTDTAAVVGDAVATPLDATATAGDAAATTAAADAAEADEAAAAAVEQAELLDTQAAEANEAALAACDAADTANSAADTATKAATIANGDASTAGAAAASADAAFTVEATSIQTIETSVQTQTLSVPDQLNAGIRSLDLQAQQVNDTININAGQYFTGANLQNTLNDVTSFLQSNPSETVVITLGNENAAVGSSNSFNTDFNNLLTSSDTAVPGTTYDSFVYSSANASLVPSLGAVRGKIVFVPAADKSWTPAVDPTTQLPLGWQPAKQVTQDSHADTDPNARWNDADTNGGQYGSGLIATDLGDATTLYRNNLNQDNSFTANVSESGNNATDTESGLSPVASGDDVDAIGDTYFGSVQVSRTTGIVGIDDPDQTLITEIGDENTLPFVVTSDSDVPSASGTLRDAILEANAQPGFNTIEFAPVLTGPTGNTIFLQSNLPTITNDLVVAGPIDVVLNGFTAFSPSSSPGINGSGSTHTVSETNLPASDSGLGTPTTSSNTAPLYVDTSGITVTSVAIPSVDPISITYGTTLSNSQLTGSEYTDTNGIFASVPGVFAFTTANGSLPHAGNGQVKAVTFTPTNTNLNPVSTTVIVNVARVTPVIPSLSSIPLTYGAALANSQLAGLTKPSGISGTYVYTNAAGSLLHAASGQAEAITFIPTDTTNYTSVSSTVQVNVAQATPTVTSVNPVSISYGTSLNNAQLSGAATANFRGSSVSVPGVFTYTTANGVTLSVGNSQSENVTFTPSDTTDYKTVSSTVSVSVGPQDTPTIVSVNPVNITYGAKLNNSQLSGIATFVLNGNTLTLPGVFTYSSAAGILLGAGQGQTEAVTFTPTDKTDYTSATSTVTVNVNVAQAVAAVQGPVNITYGAALDNSQLQGTATYNVGGSSVTVLGAFAYVNDGAVLTAGLRQTQAIVFTPADASDYAPTNSTVIVNVAQATPTLSYTVSGANAQSPQTVVPGVAPVNIAYSTPLTNDVPASSPLFPQNQLNATATYTVGGNVVTVPGLLTYTTDAGSVLSAGNGLSEAVTFTPTDTTDYATVKTTVAVNVAQLVPTVAVTDGTAVTMGTATTYSSAYTGSSQPAAGTVVDATGTSIGTPVISYYLASDTTLSNPQAGAPTAVGNYQVVGTFAASNSNYIASGDTISFSIIAPATTTTVVDGGGTYNGSPYPATSSSVTGFGGLNTTASSFSYAGTGATVYAATSVAPTNAGTYTVTASYAGDANDAPSSSNPVAFTILQATSSTSVSDASGTYTGTPFTATGGVTGAGSLSTTAGSYLYTGTGSTTYSSSTAPTSPGTYSVTATYGGDANHTGSASDPAPFTIGQATPTIAVTDAGGTFSGSAYPATATIAGVVSGVDNTPGATLETVGLTLDYVNTTTLADLGSTAPSAPGNYKVTAMFAGSIDYAPSSKFATFSIGQPAPTIVVTDAGGAFTGSAYPATATVNGGSTLETVGLTLDYVNTKTLADLGASAPSAAGSYKVTASFAGSADYISASNFTTFTIEKATPTIAVTDAGGTFSGLAYPATATIAGVVPGVDKTPGTTLETVGLTLDYVNTATLADLGSNAPSAAGNYRVTAAFAGSADYAASSNFTTFSIGQLTPTIVVTDAGGPFEGSAYPATATVNGGSTLETIGLTLDYVNATTLADLGSNAPSAAGNYNVTAAFAGSADYAASSNFTTFSIGQATPTIVVTDAGGAFNGSAYPATATVNGGSTLETVGLTLDYVNATTLADLGSNAPSAAGNYKVTATFAGSADYAASSNFTSFSIGQATPTVVVTDAGGAFKGSAYPATATVNGGSTLETVGLTLDYVNTATLADLGSTAPSAAGTYKLTASFPGSADYSSSSNFTTFSIGQATPTIAVTDVGGMFSGTAYPATVTIAGVVSGVDNTPGATLETIGLTLDYVNTATLADLGSTPPSDAGSYMVTATFAGSVDYARTSKSATFSIGQSAPTIVVTDAGGAFTGSAYPATATINGGSTLETVGLTLDYVNATTLADLGSKAPSAAGNYKVTATFAGSADYSASSNFTTFSIGQLTPTIVVTDAGGAFAGSAYPATATVNGGSTLETVGLTLDYVNTATLADLGATAPSAAGSYKVTASFAGSTDYVSAGKFIAFTIGQAAPTIAITDAGGVFNGSAYAATATVNGGPTLEGAGLTLDYVNTATMADLGSTAPTNAGSYKVTATFAGSIDYAMTSKFTTFAITQATPAITVTPYNVSFDGKPHTAAGVATGVGNVDLSADLNLTGTIHTAVGTYPSDHWSFVDPTGNYKSESGTVSDSIAVTKVAIALSQTSHVYTGQSESISVSVMPYVSYSVVYKLNGVVVTSHSNAGSYAVTVTITQPGYTGSATTTLYIAKATPIISVSSVSIAFDGKAHGAIGTATGVESPTPAKLTSLLHLTYKNLATNAVTTTAPTAPGTYAVLASFDGNADYSKLPLFDTGARVTISKAQPVFSSLSNKTIVHHTASVTLTGKIAAGSIAPTTGVPASGVVVLINGKGTVYTTTISANGTFSLKLTTSTLTAGSYVVQYAYAGNSDFAACSATSILTVM